MKLWRLYPVPDHPAVRINFQYDCAHGFVVRADDEASARKLAAKQAGDEGRKVWLSALVTRCEELTEDGATGVIMVDFHAG